MDAHTQIYTSLVLSRGMDCSQVLRQLNIPDLCDTCLCTNICGNGAIPVLDRYPMCHTIAKDALQRLGVNHVDCAQQMVYLALLRSKGASCHGIINFCDFCTLKAICTKGATIYGDCYLERYEHACSSVSASDILEAVL